MEFCFFIITIFKNGILQKYGWITVRAQVTYPHLCVVSHTGEEILLDLKHHHPYVYGIQKKIMIQEKKNKITSCTRNGYHRIQYKVVIVLETEQWLLVQFLVGARYQL